MLDIASGLALDRSVFIGERAAVLGISGTGKTNTVAVLVEELLSQGLPMTIVDVEGEYFGLKERYELLVAGKSDHVELPITPDNASVLARMSVKRGISIILDVSGYKKSEAHDLLEAYFTELWDACSEVRRPYEVVLEEAHVWIPQDKNTPLKELLTEIALRGRKRGLGIILASQRSAKVEKDILTQVPLLFLHQVVHPIDISVYKGLIPLPAKEVETIVGNLHKGQAVVKHENKPQVVQVRLRHTFHPGATPEFGEVTQPELRRVDDTLLKELQKLIAVSSPRDTAKDDKKLEKRIKDLEAERDTLLATIAEKDKEIALLSRLTVSMKGGIKADVMMPSTMEIAQANIDRATVNHAIVPTTAVQTATIVESEPIKRIEATYMPINEQKLATLKIWISKKATTNHIKILRVLHEHKTAEHKTAMNVYELSSWSGIPETTIQNKPPLELIRRGLMARDRHADGYHYQSTLQEFLAREFPNSDIEPVIRLLFS